MKFTCSTATLVCCHLILGQPARLRVVLEGSLYETEGVGEDSIIGG